MSGRKSWRFPSVFKPAEDRNRAEDGEKAKKKGGGGKLAAAIGVFCALAIGGWALLRYGPRDVLGVPPAPELSKIALDRQGGLLRAFQTPQGLWRFPTQVEHVDRTYLALLKAYEDKRFDSHMGVDPAALTRAFWRNARAGRIIGGGSTLTMQAARLSGTGGGRSYWVKARQILAALALERRQDKNAILNLYLTLAPFGGNIEGVRAASFAWFGKEPRRLSPGEAALLVALPQSPETRRPDRFPEAARRARARVVAAGLAAGVLTQEEAAAANAEALPRERKPFPCFAPHVAEAYFERAPEARVFHSTLDLDAQKTLENLARDQAARLGAKVSVALVAMDAADGRAAAIVGGADYFDAERAGAMDLTLAQRSPGSALKPFIYALAFEEGVAHPETLLEDAPSRWGLYAPENFDQGHMGPVTARKALQQSLNVPAVELLAALGPQLFLSRLRETGAALLLPDEGPPGLAVGLGGLGIRLRDAVMLFSAFARDGDAIPLRTDAAAPQGAPTRLMEPPAAWQTTDILRGAPPPPSSPANRLAFKTGTSYGYRDAWAIGYDRKRVIGVWVGRADNAPVPGITGRLTAAPILFDAFARLGLDPAAPPRPPGALIASTQDLPPPLRHIRRDIPKTVSAAVAPPLRIVFPPDGAVLDLRDADGKLAIKTTGGAPPYVFLVDGRPLGQAAARRDLFATIVSRGFSRISVLDGNGASDSVSVRLQ